MDDPPDMTGGFARRLGEAMAAASPAIGQSLPTPPDQIPAALGGTMTRAQDTADPPSAVRASAWLPCSQDALMDMGVIPDTRPPSPPPPWRSRARNWVSDWRERLARRAFRAIAGYEVPDASDY